MSQATLPQAAPVRSGFVQSVSEIWGLRHLWLSLVKMDLRTRYRRSCLGIGWSLLHPLAMTAVICVVFSSLFNLNIREYGPFLLAGFCFWNFLSGCTTQGCRCFYQAESYIRQFPMPKAIFPLRVVLGAGFHFVLALLVVILLRWGLQGFDNLAVLPLLIPCLLLLFILGWAIATIVAFANVYFPDTEHICEVVLQILFYVTPIIYPVSLLVDRGLGWILMVNPLASVIELIRAPILTGTMPSAATVGTAIAMTAILSVIAMLLTRRLQKTLVFQL